MNYTCSTACYLKKEISQSHGSNSCKHGLDDLLKSKLSPDLGNSCLTDFECGMAVGLSISETADVLGLSLTTISVVCRE